ncbi:uncharacterized protein [Anoplolepis gracilipes]|uniref:uncharacterized protein isoform X2 n=1 Tax=Anoplolepis gracilipes TaxID=354296 RepID=UPI003BA1FCEC
MFSWLVWVCLTVYYCLSLLSFEKYSCEQRVVTKVKLLLVNSGNKMGVWWFNKTIAFSARAFAALFYCVIILYNLKEKKETGTDDAAFEIKIVNPFSPNIRNTKQVFTKNSTSPNSAQLTSKVISHSSKQSISNNPVKPLRNKKLFSMQLKTEKGSNSIILNSDRFHTHDESNKVVISNNIALCKNEFGNAQDNLNHSLIIHIGNLTDLTNNKVQIKIFNKPIKQSKLDVLNTSVNYSISNRLFWQHSPIIHN